MAPRGRPLNRNGAPRSCSARSGTWAAPSGSLALRFTVIKCDDVCRTFVVKERLVHPGHFSGGDEVDSQFVIGGVELFLQRPAGDAAKQAGVDCTDPLPVAQPESPAHGLAPRCSS